MSRVSFFLALKEFHFSDIDVHGDFNGGSIRQSPIFMHFEMALQEWTFFNEPMRIIRNELIHKIVGLTKIGRLLFKIRF